MKFRLVESFDGYKKGDKVELSNGQTGTVVYDQTDDERITVSIDGMDETKYPLVDTVRPIYEDVNNTVKIPAPYDKYFEVIESEPYYYAKECSYDIAREIAQLAKRALKLPAHEVEMLEHDINNLRSNEWVEQFTQLSDKSRAKELFFKYAVEPEGYVPGDKVSGATILAEVAPKDAYVEIFDSIYNLIDDPQFPVVEIVHDRLYPVELKSNPRLGESFSKEFESRELLDTGELINALKALVKEYGHMELEKEVYLETVENDHGRQLKIGHSVQENINEEVFQDLNKKISEIDKNAREYIFDRLTDYYMHDESEAERRRVTEIIFNKLKASHSEMFDFIQYWGGGEDAADEMEVLGAPEDCRFIIENENFPEPIIYKVVTDCGFIIPDDL